MQTQGFVSRLTEVLTPLFTSLFTPFRICALAPLRTTSRAAAVARAFALAALSSVPSAQAHHSFAVHFVSDDLVEVKGTVTTFRFSNPHGVLTFEAVDASGQAVTWRAETNSPSVLRRRGWSKDSLQPGEAITVLGFPARDDSNYMRISKVTFADGRELVGQALAAPTEDQD